MCLLQQWWADNSPDIPIHYGPEMSYFVQNKLLGIIRSHGSKVKIQATCDLPQINMNVSEMELWDVNNRDDVPTTAMVSRQQPWHTNPLWAKTSIFCSKLMSDHITALPGETGPIWRFKLLNMCQCFWTEIKKCQQQWWCACHSNGEQTTALTYQSTMGQKCQILFRTHQWWENSSKNEDLNHLWMFLELWNAKFCSKQISLASHHINDIISKKEKLSLDNRNQSED